MAKITAPSITTLTKYLKKENFLPVYFFFGDDIYSVENAIKLVEEKVKPYLASDFDKETFQGKDISIVELEDMASSFPFGSEYKLIIVKNFDEIKQDKKKLAGYIRNPSPSTILILSKEGPISNLNAEPYLSMLEKDFIFEAKELKGAELINWIVKYTIRHGKTIKPENAELLTGMVGENKGLIEMQIQKIFAYLGDDKDITYKVISRVASELKEYSIFDLLNAVGNRDRYKALETANNLLDKGKEPLFIIAMLCKYFSSIARIPELEKENISDQERARLAGVHTYFYRNYKSASKFYSGSKLLDVTRALFEADLNLKSTAADPKTLILALITRILMPNNT